MLDVDGTILRMGPDPMSSPTPDNIAPSKEVVKAIFKANQVIKVGLATSRPIFLVKELLDVLKLSSPCIISGGAQILDPVSWEILWEQQILIDDVKPIYKIAKKHGINLTVLEKHINVEVVLQKLPTHPISFWGHSLDPIVADEFAKDLSVIPTISCHKVPTSSPGKIDVIISHAEATKQHGIMEVAKILKLDTKEIIGVGDGYNDFPLLMACGLKVAMGNAVPSLKEIADYVAPTVDEDGIVDVINKFVL